MKTSESQNEIAAALSKFQGALSSVGKESKAYNYYYSDLSTIWEVIREYKKRIEDGREV